MLFKNRAHEERWGNMLVQVIRQDVLHCAVYYLIAMIDLSLEECYDEDKDKIRPEILKLEALTQGEQCTIALAYDMLNGDDSTSAFDILDYDEDYLPYYVEALRNCHPYRALKYAKVFLLDSLRGSLKEKYRFPEPCQALLFARLLFNAIYKNEGYELLVMYDDKDLTYLVASNHKHDIKSLKSIEDDCGVDNVEIKKLRMELWIRLTGLKMPVEYLSPEKSFDMWEYEVDPRE